jgi:hypothetical protein
MSRKDIANIATPAICTWIASSDMTVDHQSMTILTSGHDSVEQTGRRIDHGYRKRWSCCSPANDLEVPQIMQLTCSTVRSEALIKGD